jgi:hypothetical protein
MADFDIIGELLADAAQESQGGKLVYSEGRTCFQCGKPCSEVHTMCLAKGFNVYACNACEPHGLAGASNGAS